MDRNMTSTMIASRTSSGRSFFQDELAEHLQVAQKTAETVEDSFDHLVDVCLNSLRQGGKILFFGNGGSASDAQHLATELTVRFSKNRAPIRAISLSTDTSALTAI